MMHFYWLAFFDGAGLKSSMQNEGCKTFVCFKRTIVVEILVSFK